MTENPLTAVPPTAAPSGSGVTATPPVKAKFLKLIACEIAFREICHVAARSPNLLDFEFLTQGYHDIPRTGCAEIQRRIDATPAGKYEAILIGYGLCSNILAGLRSASAGEAALVTVYGGFGTTSDDLEEVRARVAVEFPGVEVECVEGGQPLYPFIASVES